MSGIWKLGPQEELTQKSEPSVSLATLAREQQGAETSSSSFPTASG